MTYMWQETRGEPFYRVQSDDSKIIQKLKRKSGFHVTASGDITIFCCNYSRPDLARKAFKSITGQKPEIDSEGIYFVN